MSAYKPLVTPGRIKTRHLQLLAQLEKDNSLLHAAESLSLSQSAASRLLSSLEEDLGLALFTRHPGGLVPSPYGEVVTRHATAVMSEISRANREVEDLARGARTPVFIGSATAACADFLPAALFRLSEAEPDILVHVEVGMSRVLISELMNSSLDLALARVRDPSLEPELLFEPIASEALCVAVRAGHRLAGRSDIEFAELSEESWILPPSRSDMRQRVDSQWVQRGLPRLSSFFETVSFPLALSVITQSDTLTIVPSNLIRPYREAGLVAVLDVDLQLSMDILGIVTRRHHDPSPQLRRTLELFRETARRLYPSAGR